MKKWIILLIVSFLISGTVAAGDKISRHPGYIDLSAVEIPNDADVVTEVSIGPDILDLVFEPDTHREGMLAINVKTFEIDEEHSVKVREAMNKIEEKLQKENWTSIVRVKSHDEMTQVSVKFDKNNKKTLGLLVMSLEPGIEAAFVNIVGSVPLEELDHLDVNIDGDALDSLKQALE